MVHRPADSRLLTSLLSHEKEYSKSLLSLLSASQTSLASFSAYAAASTPTLAGVILSVAGSLAGADEGLGRYASAVDVWRESMKALKDLEDEIGLIIRDREILVTRLIKATKSNSSKPTRDSLLLTSASQSPLTSHSSLSLSSAGAGNATAKLTSAQAELQACESQLADKERELDGRRTAAVREGLSARCHALVECGWAWGEMGKEGLRALERLNDANHIQPPSSPGSPNAYKPLPDPTAPASDISLAPSQSASQTGHHTSPNNNHNHHNSNNNNDNTTSRISFTLPPAHSISEFTNPPMAMATSRHVLSRRITEEDLQGGSSSAEEDENEHDNIQVVENVRFSPTTTTAPKANKPTTPTTSTSRRFSIRRNTTSDSETRSEPGGGSAARRERERKGSFLGNIRDFFGGHGNKRERSGSEGGYVSSPLKKKKAAGGRWETRTERNLRAREGSSDEDGDGDEQIRPSMSVSVSVMPSVMPLIPPQQQTTKKKLSKKNQKSKTNGEERELDHSENDSVRRAEEWVGGQSAFDASQETIRPSTSSQSQQPQSTVTRKRSTTSSTGTKKKHKKKGTTNKEETDTNTKNNSSSTGAMHSRESSVRSVASAPATLPSSSSSSNKRNSTVVPPVPKMPEVPTSASSREAVSVGASVSDSVLGKTNGLTNGTMNANAKRSSLPPPHSRNHGNGNGDKAPSLMSIVEDVSRLSREGRGGEKSVGGSYGTYTGGLLQVPKAPGSVLVGHAKDDTDVATTSTSEGNKDTDKGVVENGTTATNTPSRRNSVGSYNATRPARSPLKSAMRGSSSVTNSNSNSSSSREGSPFGVPRNRGWDGDGVGASQVAKPSTVIGSSIPQSIGVTPTISVNGVSTETTGVDGGSGEGTSKEVDNSDRVSISSNETGNEVFEDADDGNDDTTVNANGFDHDTDVHDADVDDPPAPPPPPHDTPPPPPAHTHENTDAPGSDVSTSTINAANPNPTNSDTPRRRKSVRVSLQPTFSPTPPAIYDDEQDVAPWGPSSSSSSSNRNIGWQTRNTATGTGQREGGEEGERDMWEDSSEEDEEYSRARKLLVRAAGREGKGKKSKGKSS